MKKKYMNAAFVMLASCLMSFPVFGQVTTFQKVYPASLNQSGQDVVQTTDGGYMIAGSTETGTSGDLDIQISKADNFGNLVWTKTYGGSLPEYPNNILPI